jgi:hypothetical protein
MTGVALATDGKVWGVGFAGVGRSCEGMTAVNDARTQSVPASTTDCSVTTSVCWPGLVGTKYAIV